MPQIFKGLVTVSIWALVIASWLSGLLTFTVGGIIGGAAFSTSEVPMSYFAGYAVSIGYAFAAGFLVIVRKKLE